MEKAMGDFAYFSLKMDITSAKDFTFENILAKLHKAAPTDADLMTQETYADALEYFNKQAPDLQEAHKRKSMNPGLSTKTKRAKRSRVVRCMDEKTAPVPS